MELVEEWGFEEKKKRVRGMIYAAQDYPMRKKTTFEARLMVLVEMIGVDYVN